MKQTTLLLLFILFSTICFSQTINLSEYSQKNYTTKFIRADGANSFYAEIPPWVVKGGYFQYFFSTQFTSTWSSKWSMSSPRNETKSVGNMSDYGPFWVLSPSNWWGKFYDPNYLNSNSYIYSQQWKAYHWRRNYNGIFSAHVIKQPISGQQIIFAVSHGENKNAITDNYIYQNTVRPSYIINPKDPKTYSGELNGVFTDSWESYFGFLNGNWIPYDANHDWGNQYLNDLGPIAWPSAGYVNSNNTQASAGLRHPSSIVYGNYIYIYVCDESRDGTGGVKLIRCMLSNLLNPLFYETWSEIKGWIPSLPNGFSKNTCASYFAKRGPMNTPVFPNERNTVKFTIAKFKNTNQFIGVEQYNDDYDNNRAKLAFRFSSDLIHWSKRIDFYTNSTLKWSELPLKYPIFLSSDGTSNTDIDLNDFFVIGTSKDNSITKLLFHKIAGRFANLNEFNFYETIEKSNNLANIVFPNISDIVKIIPNLQNKKIDINLMIKEDAPCKISIYNSLGLLLYTMNINLKEKIDYEYHVPFLFNENGVYFVIISKKNEIIGRATFIK